MMRIGNELRAGVRDVVRDAVALGKATFSDFIRHNGQWQAAALAYFSLFSIAPLLIVVIGIVGFFVHGHADVRHEIFNHLAQTAGPAEAQAVSGIVDSTFDKPHKTVIAEAVSWGFFFLGAIGLFNALQFALNTVWGVNVAKHGGIWWTIRNRIVSFGMVLAIAFLLLVSLVINSLLTAFGDALAHVFPGFHVLMKIADFIVSLAVITVLFALIYRYLPDAEIKWEDVWIGAVLTAVLFDIGQFLLGLYLGRASISSAYGTFGSLVVLLLWVNYSAQILLVGAEFTHVFAETRGSRASGSGGSTRGPVPVATTTATAEGRVVEAPVTARDANRSGRS